MIDVRPGRMQKSTGSSGSGNQPVSAPMIFASPRGGLVTSTDMASDITGAASVLDNWLPTLTGARIRGGSAKVGLAEDTNSLVSAFSYTFAGTQKLFMASTAALYEFTAPEPLPDTTPAVVSGLTGGDWSAFQHTTAGAGYLIAVNGIDQRQVFDGTTWGTTPAMAFSDGTTSDQMSHGWLFKNHEIYIKAGSLDAYFITAVNAVGGPAVVFPLGGTMLKGGTLVTGFAWSIESGDGANAYCVFISSEGEAAVFAGADPTGDDFQLRGNYQIGKPLGKTAFLAVGSDILVATTAGLISMTDVLQRNDPQRPTLSSLSQAIDDEWQLVASATGNGWTLTEWPEQSLLLVTIPDNAVLPGTTFVMNTVTKKWTFIRGWEALCFAPFQGRIFFGSTDGYCWAGDAGGEDDGHPFQASYLSTFNSGGTFGQQKTASLGIMHMKAKSRPNVRLFARADGDTSVPTMTAATAGDGSSSDWDVGLWDLALWDQVSNFYTYLFRQNVRAKGETLAMGCVITSSGPFQLAVKLDLAELQVQGGAQNV